MNIFCVIYSLTFTDVNVINFIEKYSYYVYYSNLQLIVVLVYAYKYEYPYCLKREMVPKMNSRNSDKDAHSGYAITVRIAAFCNSSIYLWL